MSNNKIGIASDHAGFELKQSIVEYFKELALDYQWELIDYGCTSPDISVDYPVFAQSICTDIRDGVLQRGILVCGSGVGMSIAANKAHNCIRASLCNEPISAKLTRLHNDSNILCMGSWFVTTPLSKEIIKTWLDTNFSHEARHQRRVNLLTT